jgi:hypothetical protein
MSEPVETYPYSIDTFKDILVQNSGASVDFIEQKSHISYFDEYFKKIGTQTFLVEYNYVDRDFLEDFAGCYARCFPDYNRKCVRLHFFKLAFTAEEFKIILADLSAKAPSSPDISLHSLQKSYLGFMVIKPLPQTVIGRTCIATYPTEKSNRRHYPIIRKYKVNLFGLDLSIDSLAFQEQDRVAAACATSALWTVFHGTGMQFQHSIPSPVEITQKAFSNFPLVTRVAPLPTQAFPNAGLSAEMMAQAIRDVGLEPYYVDLSDEPEYFLKGQLYAYLKFGIPMVFTFDILEIDPEYPERLSVKGRHAVAVTGFSLGHSQAQAYSSCQFLLTASRIDKIYVHDDQVGPFARMEIDGTPVDHPKLGSLFSISTSWGRGKYRACPRQILVPLYHKILIPFNSIHDTILHFDASLIDTLRSEDMLPSMTDRLEWDIYLTTCNIFKSSIFNDTALSGERKQGILLRSLPRFLWRATAFQNDIKFLDLLFDATDIAQGNFLVCVIEYDQELSEVLREVSKESWLAAIFQTEPEGKIVEWFKNQ